MRIVGRLSEQRRQKDAKEDAKTLVILLTRTNNPKLRNAWHPRTMIDDFPFEHVIDLYGYPQDKDLPEIDLDRFQPTDGFKVIKRGMEVALCFKSEDDLVLFKVSCL